MLNRRALVIGKGRVGVVISRKRCHGDLRCTVDIDDAAIFDPGR
jgi:hypothetical protein